MGKTVKIALELNLDNAEQLSLYLAIGSALGKGLESATPTTAPVPNTTEVPAQIANPQDIPGTTYTVSNTGSGIPLNFGPTSVSVPTPTSVSVPTPVSEPVVAMQDILSKVTSLIMSTEAKGKNEPLIKKWMADHNYSGKVVGIPEDLRNEFYAFISAL